jgi:hypothetical protein
MLFAMDPRYRIRALKSRSGKEIALPTRGVTCIVGRNNVGKSLTLNDIVLLSTSGPPDAVTLVLDEILTDKSELSRDDAQTWLSENFPLSDESLRNHRAIPSYKTSNGQALSAETFCDYWGGPERSNIGAAAGFFVLHLPAGTLVHRATAQHYSAAMGVPTSPIARVHVDHRLEAELSNLAFQAFGKRLTLDRVSFQGSMLRVGEVSIPRPAFNDSSLEYFQALTSLPELDREGEGVKSFLGLALEVLAGQYQVLIVDEPEAFLHPGQARALGRWLGRVAAEKDKQVILATHDRDIVIGLLDSGAEAEVAVIRVDRTADTTDMHYLGHADVVQLWSDPVNRYSNVLQGLFHANVVICEGDADCRFYGAVLDELSTEGDFRAVSDDTLFVPSGGKNREYKLARSLTKLRVHTSAIVDFDALFDKRMIRDLVESLDGSWSTEIKTDYQIFLDHLNTLDETKKETLKEHGIDALEKTPHNACRRLIDNLALQGLLVVDYGEMEDLDKSIEADKGAPWVSEMLEKGHHRTNNKARAMLQRLTFLPKAGDPPAAH